LERTAGKLNRYDGPKEQPAKATPSKRAFAGAASHRQGMFDPSQSRALIMVSL